MKDSGEPEKMTACGGGNWLWEADICRKQLFVGGNYLWGAAICGKRLSVGSGYSRELYCTKYCG